MISRNQKKSSNNYLINKTNSAELSTTENSTSHLENTISEYKQSSTKQNNRPEINERETPIRWTDKGVAYSTIILAAATIILAVYTYFLFKEAVSESESSHQTHLTDSILAEKRFGSDTAAIGAQTRNSEKMYELNKTANENSQAISKATLQQQISSLGEFQKEFEISNRPFLQSTAFELDTLKVGGKIYLSYSLQEYGTSPIKIISVVENLQQV